jgi:hypothetical protein
MTRKLKLLGLSWNFVIVNDKSNTMFLQTLVSNWFEFDEKTEGTALGRRPNASARGGRVCERMQIGFDMLLGAPILHVCGRRLPWPFSQFSFAVLQNSHLTENIGARVCVC